MIWTTDKLIWMYLNEKVCYFTQRNLTHRRIGHVLTMHLKLSILVLITQTILFQYKNHIANDVGQSRFFGLTDWQTVSKRKKEYPPYIRKNKAGYRATQVACECAGLGHWWNRPKVFWRDQWCKILHTPKEVKCEGPTHHRTEELTDRCMDEQTDWHRGLLSSVHATKNLWYWKYMTDLICNIQYGKATANRVCRTWGVGTASSSFMQNNLWRPCWDRVRSSGILPKIREK